jgi:hypothetical protein
MENQNNNQAEGQGQDQAPLIGRWSNAAQLSSALSRTTLSRIRNNRPSGRGTTYTIHDQRSRGYGWLLPGWLGEERHTSSGRTYRVIVLILYSSNQSFENQTGH